MYKIKNARKPQNCCSLPIWYLGSQDQDLTLGLEDGPKAIGEVWKAQFCSRSGLHPTNIIIRPQNTSCIDKLAQRMAHHIKCLNNSPAVDGWQIN